MWLFLGCTTGRTKCNRTQFFHTSLFTTTFVSFINDIMCFIPSLGRPTSHSNAALLLDLYSTRQYFAGCRLQARNAATICDWIFTSCRRYIPRLFHRMLWVDYQGELCYCVWATWWDAGQWIPIGYRRQYFEGANQAAKHIAHISQYCYWKIQVNFYFDF